MESAEKVRNRLDNLRLDTNTTALQYISEFQDCISLLEDMKESYTESKTREIFLNQITDMDYQKVTHSLCFLDMPIEICYQKIRKMQSLLSLKNNPRDGISPRKMEIDGNTKEYYLKKYQTSLGFISVPDNIWKSLTSEQRKVILDHNSAKKRERKREREKNWSSQGQENKRL